MNCPELYRTSAFLDGELEGTGNIAAESHIATCPICQEFVAAAASASDALRRPAARFTAPPDLRARIRRDLDAETRMLDTKRPVGAGQRSFWWGAFSGVGVAGLAAVLAFVAVLPPQPETLVSALADAHIQALMGGHTVEMPFSTHHVLKPWFAGRAPLSPPVIDLSAEGFALAGGRVDTVAGTKTAVLSYRHGAHEIDLFVWAGGGGPLPASDERHGYKVLSWKTDDLNFAAVSDMQADELQEFVRLVQAARE